MHKMPVSDLKDYKTNKDSALKEWYNNRDKSLSEKTKEKTMSKLSRATGKLFQTVVDKVMGNGLMQEENVAVGEKHITPGMPILAMECAAEGIVLLRNEEGLLPLKNESRVAVFGRCQLDWFYVGYGSGGDVHPPYQVSPMEGFRNHHITYDEQLAKVYEEWCNDPSYQADHGWWGHWPYFYPEMPLEEEMVAETSKRCQIALIVIGRAAGEDRENKLEAGSYYLTEEEKRMLELVRAHFSDIVLVFNCGNVMDLEWLETYPAKAVLYAWNLGQESGNALAKVLTGEINPSGKLADSIAKKYEYYSSAPYFGGREFNNYTEDIFVGYRYFETFHPQKVLYPFGYGLSYTTFKMQGISIGRGTDYSLLEVQVTNTGKMAGKQVVQIYANLPQGLLPKEKRRLVAFAKTELLLPEQSQTLSFTLPDRDFASFDDSGVTGHKDAFVLEAGTYGIEIGENSHDVISVGSFSLNEVKLVEQCKDICVPDQLYPFKVINEKGFGDAYLGGRDLRQRILESLPTEIPVTGNKGIKLSDVKEGKATLEQFVAQLEDKDLGDLSHGEGAMNSQLGVSGNAGVFAGITPKLRKMGVPAIVTADGPAGLRLNTFTTLLPCGTAIACTWNQQLVEQIFVKMGEEATYFGVDVLLSPGMNIHRNPLCGRNFEYYSEDPILSGKIAAAAVRGIQKGGISACPKHFACNNQEVNRNQNDSRLSQRALREIYLRNFEICVKEGKPQNLMTSYNKINGVWAHYNYDLVTTVLRDEWRYEGNVITDWWMRKSASPEFPTVKDNAYRVRAQVDVLMPGNGFYTEKGYKFDKAQLKTLGKPDGLTRAELQRSAMNVLRFALFRI